QVAFDVAGDTLVVAGDSGGMEAYLPEAASIGISAGHLGIEDEVDEAVRRCVGRVGSQQALELGERCGDIKIGGRAVPGDELRKAEPADHFRSPLTAGHGGKVDLSERVEPLKLGAVEQQFQPLDRLDRVEGHRGGDVSVAEDDIVVPSP